MNKNVELVLNTIEMLNEDELAAIYRKIGVRLKRKRNVRNLLSRYAGKGRGVWQIDGQEYVNQLRTE